MPNPAKDFLRAAKNGDTTTLRALLDADPGLLTATDTDGSTALHCACWKDHREVVALLLDAGADVNAKDPEGRTPLAHTEFHKATAAAKLLAKNGGV